MTDVDLFWKQALRLRYCRVASTDQLALEKCGSSNKILPMLVRKKYIFSIFLPRDCWGGLKKKRHNIRIIHLYCFNSTSNLQRYLRKNRKKKKSNIGSEFELIYFNRSMEWSTAAHDWWQQERLVSMVKITSQTTEPGGEGLALWSEWFESCLKLKHDYGLRWVSPISSHTLFKLTGQPATKANQHFKEHSWMAFLGTRASVKAQPDLLSMIISSAKQTSNYVKITLACEKKLDHSVLGWGWSEMQNSSSTKQDRTDYIYWLYNAAESQGATTYSERLK